MQRVVKIHGLQVLCATADEYPKTDADWDLRNTWFNDVALVGREWRQLVAPMHEAIADYRLHRRVVIKRNMDEAEFRQWWTVVKMIPAQNHHLTDAGIIALANGCPRLIDLNLAKICRDLTDDSIIALANGCPALCILDFANCYNMTDAAMIALANGCPDLSSVNLMNCREVTDAAIIALANGCPQLGSVGLANCSNLTDAAVIALANGCPGLSSVDLRGCRNVSREAKATMKATCSEVSIKG